MNSALKAVATRTAEPSGSAIFQDLLNRPFSPDAFHAMEERDNALVRDEVMHGAASKSFVYEFEIQGKKVAGVSVIGARELAAQYKGIKSRIVATVEKRGALFIFRTFTPLSIDTRVLHELEADGDFYECVMEVSDIKTGNSIEVRKKETRMERKRDGTMFERPHYDVICESKAFRNGVLSVLPQSVIQDFKKRSLVAGNSSAEETIDQRRAKVIAFSVKHGMSIDRQALGEVSFAELDGLGAAARDSLDAFRRAAVAMGLVAAAGGDASAPKAAAAPPPPAAKKAAAQKAKEADEAPAKTEPEKRSYAQLADQILNAADAESAAVFLDEARGQVDEKQLADLGQVFSKKWSA